MLWSALSSWDFEPIPVLGVATAAFLYWNGRRASGAPRSRSWDFGDTCFCAGLAPLFLALVSPIDSFSGLLQWDHMVQHVILLLVAPPLILLADPFQTAWNGLCALRPELDVNRLTRLTHALRGGRGAAGAIVVLFSADLFFWHFPALYDLTLRVEWVHNLEHTLFLALGLLFWGQVIGPLSAAGRLSLGGRAGVLFGGMLAGWILAVVIGYSPRPLYAYAGSTGLSALNDQQIAAGVMWVPGSVPFLGALVWLLVAWFDRDERAAAETAGLSP